MYLNQLPRTCSTLELGHLENSIDYSTRPTTIFNIKKEDDFHKLLRKAISEMEDDTEHELHDFGWIVCFTDENQTRDIGKILKKYSFVSQGTKNPEKTGSVVTLWLTDGPTLWSKFEEIQGVLDSKTK